VDLHDTQYIAVAGWNRRLTVYLDEPDQLVLHPCTILPLEDQVDAWHKDDILSMAFCAPNFIATSSYDGIVILTNIHSATIVHVINPAEYEPEKPLLRSIDKGIDSLSSIILSN
jgi:WD40 repeat protein